MNILFVSNYLNHHQKKLCEEIIRNVEQFYFVETDENHQQGYQTRIEEEAYVLRYCGNEKAVEELLLNADVVIFGACPNHLIDMRMRENKLSFLYSERFLKKGLWRRFIPQTRKKIIQRVVQYKDRNLYVLCASAFLANDLKLFGFPTEKCFKWGYYPEIKNYQIAELCAGKNKRKILWVGRFLKLKHPDDVLMMAKRLKDAGYEFQLGMVGAGILEEKLKGMVDSMGLSDCVTFHGSVSSSQVRVFMEEAGIYLFTSDRREGWGAVMNESMNSGCAVVASHIVGSVPYLMKHKDNGLVYHSGDVDSLYENVKYLLDNPNEQERLGIAAYETIVNQWNAETAAQRLVALSEYLREGQKKQIFYESGPCSQAEIVCEKWF